jgi:hypothetical protein
MNYSILNAEGKAEARLAANSVEEACREWANRCWKEHAAEEAVIKAARYQLDGQPQAAFLDPYLVAPSGLEDAYWATHQAQFDRDVHLAPDPALSSEPRTVDTGGPNPGS